jgi:hypothetical protein
MNIPPCFREYLEKVLPTMTSDLAIDMASSFIVTGSVPPMSMDARLLEPRTQEEHLLLAALLAIRRQDPDYLDTCLEQMGLIPMRYIP